MKVALLATLLTFGGSLAGFGLTAGSSDAPSPGMAAGPPAALMDDVVVRGEDRDCPKAEAEKT
jgi:hypothetical protein